MQCMCCSYIIQYSLQLSLSVIPYLRLVLLFPSLCIQSSSLVAHSRELRNPSALYIFTTPFLKVALGEP